MPKKIPLTSIGVARDGKTVFPPVGVAFEFTDEEVSQMNALSKKDGVDYFRDPLNEVADVPPMSEKQAAEVAKAVKAAKAVKGAVINAGTDAL